MTTSSRYEQHGFDLDRVVSEALDRALSATRLEDRASMLRALRLELERCLTEAPTTTNAMDTIRLRAQLAVALDEALNTAERRG